MTTFRRITDRPGRRIGRRGTGFAAFALAALLLITAAAVGRAHVLASHIQPGPRVLRYTMVFETTGQSMWGPGATALPSGGKSTHVWTEPWAQSGSTSQLKNIDIKIADYDFGGGLTGSTSGLYDAWSTIELGAGSVTVRYPVEVTLILPPDQSYFPYQVITIQSSMTALPGTSLTVTPPEGVLDALWTREASFDLTAKVCLFHCSTGTVFSESFPSETFTVVRGSSRTEGTAVDPESIWAKGGVGGYVRVPNVFASTTQPGADGRTLIAEGADARFVDLTLDGDGLFTRKLGYCGAYKGATLCADAVDISLHQMADQQQRFTFIPKLRVVLEFPETVVRQRDDGTSYVEAVAPVTFTERDPAGQIVAQGVSRSVSFAAGNQVDLLVSSEVALQVKPRFVLDNSFANETATILRKDVKMRVLEAHLDVPKKKVTDEFELTPKVCAPVVGCTPAVTVPETWSPRFEIDLGPLHTKTILPNYEAVTDSNWLDGDRAPWPLEGFATVTSAPFTMTPNLGFTIVEVIGPVNNITDEGTLVEFRSAAYSKDGDPLINRWDFGDGYTTEGAVVQHAYGDNTVASGGPTAFIVALSPDDGHGAVCPVCATWPMVVRNVPPTVDLRMDRALMFRPRDTGFVPISPTIQEGTRVGLRPHVFDKGILDTHTFSLDFGEGGTKQTGTLQLFPVGAPGLSDYGAVLEPTGLGTGYDDDGTYTFKMTVCDDDGGCGQDSHTFTVVNAAPEVEATKGLIVPAGRPVEIEVARFFDAGVKDTHTAFISWGDGTTSSGAEVTISGAPAFDPVRHVTGFLGVVKATHTYALRSERYISLCVTDDDAGVDCADGFLHVSMTMDPLPNVIVDEGETVYLKDVRFTDLDDGAPYSGHVSWGDDDRSWNLPIAPTTGPGGVVSGTFSSSHAYRDDGVYSAHVSFGARDGGGPSRWITVTVRNLPPVVEAGPDLAGFVDSAVRIALPPHSAAGVTVSDPGALDVHTLEIDWGDGSEPETIAIGPLGPVTANHVFTRARIYEVTLCATDDDGATGCDSLLANISANTRPVVEVARVSHDVSDATEGTAAAVDVSFTDPDLGDQHTAIVDWGDGSPPEAIGQVASEFAIAHSYAADGVYTVLITVSDGIVDGTATLSLVIANAPPVLDPLALSADAVDEDGVIALDVGFDDPGALDTHTVTVDWGDGSPAETTVLAMGQRALSGSHRYRDDPPGESGYTLTVTVDDGADTRSVSAFVHVANVAPALKPLSLSATAIDEDGSITVAGTFVDPGTLDAHTVTLDWGDGTTEVLSPAIGARAFTASHRYLDNPDGAANGFTLAVTVADDDGGADSTTVAIAVANVAPAVGSMVVSPASITEGNTADLAGEISDPGTLDVHSLTIDWGDGTPIEVIVLPLGARSFLATHLYLDDQTESDADDYEITVTLADDEGARDGASAQVTVANVAPSVRAAGLAIDEGHDAILAISVRDPGVLDTHTLIIDWGDGRAPEQAAVPLSTSDVIHRYAQDGEYAVRITVRDDDGGEGTWVVLIAVANVAPEVYLARASALEGSPAALDLRFVDPGSEDAHTATVDWGDGSSLDQLGTLSGGATLTHTYADDGQYTVTVTVYDDDASGAATSTVSVTNVAPDLIASPSAGAITSGQALTLSARFTDPGLLDPHIATIDWGDGVIETAALNETAGAGSFTGSHRFTLARSYTVIVCVSDDDAQVCRPFALDVERLSVAIDIDPNSLQLGSKGMLKVSLLGAPAFAAERVAAGGVRFGPSGTETAPVDVKVKEAKKAWGEVDFKFNRLELGIAGDTPRGSSVTLILTGALADGTEFIGTSSVRIKGGDVAVGEADDRDDD